MGHWPIESSNLSLSAPVEWCDFRPKGVPLKIVARAMDDISRHKAALRQKQVELRELLWDWDPIGVAPDGPRDEYDCLFGLIGRLREGASVAELDAYLTNELVEHFGPDPEPASPAEFAAKLQTWYWADPLPGSVASR